MNEFDAYCLPKYNQRDPLQRPVFGQRPRIKMEILSYWATKVVFWSFYSSLLLAILLRYYTPHLMWGCRSICGQTCGRLPDVDLSKFGASCRVQGPPCSLSVQVCKPLPTHCWCAVFSR